MSSRGKMALCLAFLYCRAAAGEGTVKGDAARLARSKGRELSESTYHEVDDDADCSAAGLDAIANADDCETAAQSLGENFVTNQYDENGPHGCHYNTQYGSAWQYNEGVNEYTSCSAWNMKCLCVGAASSTPATVSGCMDANANNYDPDATTQSFNSFGNMACEYSACEDTPAGDGCMYGDSWKPFDQYFDSSTCSQHGATSCTTSSLSCENWETGGFWSTDCDGNPSCDDTNDDGLTASECCCTCGGDANTPDHSTAAACPPASPAPPPPAPLSCENWQTGGFWSTDCDGNPGCDDTNDDGLTASECCCTCGGDANTPDHSTAAACPPAAPPSPSPTPPPPMLPGGMSKLGNGHCEGYQVEESQNDWELWPDGDPPNGVQDPPSDSYYAAWLKCVEGGEDDDGEKFVPEFVSISKDGRFRCYTTCEHLQDDDQFWITVKMGYDSPSPPPSPALPPMFPGGAIPHPGTGVGMCTSNWAYLDSFPAWTLWPASEGEHVPPPSSYYKALRMCIDLDANTTFVSIGHHGAGRCYSECDSLNNNNYWRTITMSSAPSTPPPPPPLPTQPPLLPPPPSPPPPTYPEGDDATCTSFNFVGGYSPSTCGPPVRSGDSCCWSLHWYSGGDAIVWWHLPDYGFIIGTQYAEKTRRSSLRSPHWTVQANVSDMVTFHTRAILGSHYFYVRLSRDSFIDETIWVRTNPGNASGFWSWPVNNVWSESVYTVDLAQYGISDGDVVQIEFLADSYEPSAQKYLQITEVHMHGPPSAPLACGVGTVENTATSTCEIACSHTSVSESGRRLQEGELRVAPRSIERKLPPAPRPLSESSPLREVLDIECFDSSGNKLGDRWLATGNVPATECVDARGVKIVFERNTLLGFERNFGPTELPADTAVDIVRRYILEDATPRAEADALVSIAASGAMTHHIDRLGQLFGLPALA